MNNSARYGIYYAPAQNGRFWTLASQWLGRDAASNEGVVQDVPKCLEAADFARATESARRYGFHATLKAPFHLADGEDEAQLFQAAAEFAATQAPAEIGRLVVRSLDGFLAIVPHEQPDEVADLAQNCVTHFEPYRAPMSATQRDRRVSAGLNARQTDLLDRFGYPYVMEQFRLHLTLTNRLPADALDPYMAAANARFAEILFDDWVLDRIAVYREDVSGEGFVRIADFPLTGE